MIPDKKPRLTKRNLGLLLTVPILAFGFAFSLPVAAEPTPPGEVQGTEEPAATGTPHCCPTTVSACCNACSPKTSDCGATGQKEMNCTDAQKATECPSSGSPSTSADSNGGSTSATYQLANPFGTNSLRVIIGRFGSIMTSIVGSLALLMFVYGGFILLTSRGNADKIKQGREVFIWTTVGLVIIFGAQAIITAIINILSQGHL